MARRQQETILREWAAVQGERTSRAHADARWLLLSKCPCGCCAGGRQLPARGLVCSLVACLHPNVAAAQMGGAGAWPEAGRGAGAASKE